MKFFNFLHFNSRLRYVLVFFVFLPPVSLIILVSLKYGAKPFPIHSLNATSAINSRLNRPLNTATREIIVHFFAAVGVLGSTCNVLVLVVHYIVSSTRSQSSHFVACLALTDLVLCALLVYPAFYKAIMGNTLLTKGQCLGWLYVFLLLTAASIYTITVISLDRYLGVTEPLRRTLLMRSQGVVKMMGGVWTAAFLLALPVLVLLLRRYYDDEDTEKEEKVGLMQCHQVQPLWYMVLRDLLVFLLPLAAMGEAYRRVSRQVKVRSRLMAAGVMPLTATSEMSYTDGGQRVSMMRVHRGGGLASSHTLVHRAIVSGSLPSSDLFSFTATHHSRVGAGLRQVELRKESVAASAVDSNMDHAEIGLRGMASIPDRLAGQSKTSVPPAPKALARAGHKGLATPPEHSSPEQLAVCRTSSGHAPNSSAVSGIRRSSLCPDAHTSSSDPSLVSKQTRSGTSAYPLSSSNASLTARRSRPPHGILTNWQEHQGASSSQQQLTPVEQPATQHKASNSSAFTIAEEGETSSEPRPSPARRLSVCRDPEPQQSSQQESQEKYDSFPEEVTYVTGTPSLCRKGSMSNRGSGTRVRAGPPSRSPSSKKITWMPHADSHSTMLSAAPPRVPRSDSKAMVTLTVLLVLYVFFWLPYFLLMPLCLTCWQRGEDWMNMDLCALTPWLGLCNSFVNPLVYAWAKPDYRRALRALCRGKLYKPKQVRPNVVITRGATATSSYHYREGT